MAVAEEATRKWSRGRSCFFTLLPLRGLSTWTHGSGWTTGGSVEDPRADLVERDLTSRRVD